MSDKRSLKNALAFLMELWSESNTRASWFGDLGDIMEKEIEHGITSDLLATIAYLYAQVGEWPDFEYWSELDD